MHRDGCTLDSEVHLIYNYLVGAEDELFNVEVFRFNVTSVHGLSPIYPTSPRKGQ